MSLILSSQGIVLATAMAVSGTAIILTAFRLQKSHFSPSPIIHSSDEGKKKDKKKKRVHFAKDVVDPIGNSDDYRKLHSKPYNSIQFSNPSKLNKGVKVRLMPANRVALYNGMLRDRVIHRVAYSH